MIVIKIYTFPFYRLEKTTIMFATKERKRKCMSYSNSFKFFYVAIQIIGKYLLFINYSVSIT